MKYDFTTVLERKGHDALALDALGDGTGFAPAAPEKGFSALPMWVADMSFPVAPSVTEAITDRLKHPTFGYFLDSDEYFSSIISWHKKRNGTDIPREAIGYENGVLGCLASAVRAFGAEGKAVFVHAPTYIGFQGTLKNLGCRIVSSDLYRDENGVWRIDYEDTEKKISENDIGLAIFCSPFNPVGRVWEKEEIKKFVDICEKHNTLIFSDEIWSDIILGNNRFVPTFTVSEYAREHTVTAYAPSKTFNLAGLIGSYHVIFNAGLREKLTKYSESTHYNDMNVLSQHALTGAYKPEGMEWLDELRAVLSENVDYACEHIANNYKGISFAKPQGTYMLFIDLTKYLENTGKDFETVLKAGWKVGVIWQDGRPFGGNATIRINLALPLSLVKEAFERLDKYVL